MPNSLMRWRKYLPLGELRGSIRLRLTLWYVALLAVVLVAFSVGIYIFLSAHVSSEVSDVERTYEQQYTHAASHARLGLVPHSLKTVPRNSGLFGQLGVYYQSRFDATLNGASELAIDLPQRKLLSSEATAVLVGAQAPGCHSTASDNLACAWLVTANNGSVRGVVGMFGSLSGVVQSEDEVRTAVIVGVPLSLLIALIGGWMLASRALSPIEDLRLTAQSITATDLSRRIGMQRDDELGRLARTLDEMIAGLDAAFNEQRRLTADVSHELRTPLSVIQAQASLALKRARSPQEYSDVISSIQEETQRMTKIVDDLLLLARAEAGQEVLELDPVRLDVVARWSVEQLHEMALDQKVDVQTSLKPSMVAGDRGRLQQMTLNLLNNAIRYTPPGGTIKVKVSAKADSAVLVVTDTGVGIPLESIPHVFDRFFMTDRSRSEGGSGLGLSIVQWIVDAHGGSITVESRPGHGSTFTVKIPMHAVDRMDEPQAPQRSTLRRQTRGSTESDRRAVNARV